MSTHHLRDEEFEAAEERHALAAHPPIEADDPRLLPAPPDPEAIITRAAALATLDKTGKPISVLIEEATEAESAGPFPEVGAERAALRVLIDRLHRGDARWALVLAVLMGGDDR